MRIALLGPDTLPRLDRGYTVRKIVLVAAVLVILALWLFDMNPLSPGTTVYSVYCGEDTGKEGTCINLTPITYRPTPHRQEVSYWTDTETPTTLPDCAMRDYRNWECWYKDKGGRLSMVDGVFHEEVFKDIPGKDTFDSVRYVPKWKWWAVKLGVHLE